MREKFPFANDSVHRSSELLAKFLRKSGCYYGIMAQCLALDRLLYHYLQGSGSIEEEAAEIMKELI